MSRPRPRRRRRRRLMPLTPYGAAKAYSFFIVRSYRRRYGLHASSGILYNHESPRRPLDFLPRKVANGAARISLGLDEELCPRRSRRAPRLGLRGRLRARDVADAAAGRARRLRDRNRRHTLGRGSRAAARSSTSASTGESTFASTSRCGAARRSSTISSATRPRPVNGSAGSRRPTSIASCACWWTRTWRSPRRQPSNEPRRGASERLAGAPPTRQVAVRQTSS